MDPNGFCTAGGDGVSPAILDCGPESAHLLVLAGEMENQKSIIGQKIKRLLQTPSESMGVIIEEFGEAFWIYLVAELENGQLIQVNEYDWSSFTGNEALLIPAELTQEEFSLSDIEGHTIVDVRPKGKDYDGFAIVLENGLHFYCPGEPGGNGPFIFRPEDEDEDWDGLGM